MGGEKHVDIPAAPGDQGSPPHGRGKMRFGHLVKVSLGTTPAWAGKSGRSHHLGQHVRDHPRMGGEKAAQRLLSHSDPGSPPRRRGKDGSCPRLIEIEGITPAWAGKRLLDTLEKIRNQDHPRVGGEKIAILTLSLTLLGSPPRGRGKAGHGSDIAQRHGITPA